MTYVNVDRLAALDAAAFRATRPYPWINPAGALTDTGYERLLATLPDPALFEPLFGVARAHGQQSHDRLALEYRTDLAVAQPWHDFVAELRGPAYRRFLRRMLGRSLLSLGFHWHYTPNGCSVSPHCDAKHKLGSHIFYFNTEHDWRPEWGGQTVVLDDGGRFPRHSAPRFEEFDRIITSEALGNRSLLFMRGASSWHGVQEIHCPAGAYRKVFIVVINDWVRFTRRRLKARLAGKRASSY